MTQADSLRISLPSDLKAKLEGLATGSALTAEEIAVEAIARYVALAAEADAGTREGIADADAGRVIEADRVHAWLRSWGKPDELPPPG